jgi:6-phosphofructokinase 1
MQKVFHALSARGITHVYFIGGMGTVSFVKHFKDFVRRQGAQLSLITIPCVLENDLPFFDQSVGFSTGLEESIEFIESATVEAEGAENAVGVIRLTGKRAGYLAVGAALASQNVDICLVPEMSFSLYGAHGVYEAICQKAMKDRCIIVITEGAVQGLQAEDAM